MKTRIETLLLLTFVFYTNILLSQSILQSNVTKSDLIVKGTSSMHDWVMTAEKFNCSVLVNNTGNTFVIKDVNFTCNSTLKSDNSIMDKKAWDALKTKEFKSIQFASKEVIAINSTNQKTEGTIQGELKLKGITKKISLPYKGELDELGNLNIKGDLKLKMSEFGIDPPTALMGSLKTGDEVTVSFQIVFDQINLVSINK